MFIPRRLPPGSQARTARTRRRTWTEPTAEEAVQQQQQRPGDSYQAVLCFAVLNPRAHSHNSRPYCIPLSRRRKL
ncbi:hypothetical protein CCUS01_09341 [Colletotrichum cuscutae]|uniref:Uncharacterized protein n=1 Tax=Colletotrichum cuscutae TaxID=1209917 RepID=A0AAI9UJZ7_9PEZI|nr:hypothetical protein CCUS01_09341 [Colletotrichum cuscutae]